MRFELPAFEGLTLTRRGIVSSSRTRNSLSIAEVRDAVRALGGEPRFTPAQIREGAQIELEHTPDAIVAVKIALDHLRERPDYYARLKRFVER
jgi:hypothetical protein